MKRIKELCKKHSEVILYIIFGVLTTVVNFVVFWLFSRLFGEKIYLVNNALAWVIAVAFAYVTNKLFVFESRSWNAKIVAREVVEFLGARLFSLAVEEGGLWIFVSLLGFDKISLDIASAVISGQIIAKVILAVIVVILNYIFSKFIIFKKGK